MTDSGSDHDNNLWKILLKRRRYLKIYLIQHFFLHKFTVDNYKNSQTLMVVCASGLSANKKHGKFFIRFNVQDKPIKFCYNTMTVLTSTYQEDFETPPTSSIY